MKNLLSLKERSIKRILLLASRLVINRSPEGLKKIVALLEMLASRKDKKFFITNIKCSRTYSSDIKL